MRHFGVFPPLRSLLPNVTILRRSQGLDSFHVLEFYYVCPDNKNMDGLTSDTMWRSHCSAPAKKLEVVSLASLWWEQTEEKVGREPWEA